MKAAGVWRILKSPGFSLIQQNLGTGQTENSSPFSLPEVSRGDHDVCAVLVTHVQFFIFKHFAKIWPLPGAPRSPQLPGGGSVHLQSLFTALFMELRRTRFPWKMFSLRVP